MSQLHLSQYLRDQLGLLASLGYPNPTCGLLYGKQESGHISVQRIEQLEYPEQNPLDSPFEVDSIDLIYADNKAHRQGLEIVGLWRTAPDQHLSPSEEDRLTAWPEYSYLVITVSSQGVESLHSWRLNRTRFTEEDLRL